jgi:hypothetical protein
MFVPSFVLAFVPAGRGRGPARRARGEVADGRLGGDGEDARGLVDGQALGGHEEKDLAARGGQPRDRALEARRRRGRDRGRFGRGVCARACRVQVPPPGERRETLAVEHGPASMVAVQVAGDGVEPRAQMGVPLQAPRMACEAHPGLLEQVLRELAPSAEPDEEPQDRLAVLFVGGGERGGLARAQPGDQLGVHDP